MKQDTDIQLVDRYIDTCLRFINPAVFNEIRARGLYNIVNMLPKDKDEAKAVAYARLQAANKAFGDPEIDEIANNIQRLESLRKQLIGMNMADAHATLPILTEMFSISTFVLSYYK